MRSVLLLLLLAYPSLVAASTPGAASPANDPEPVEIVTLEQHLWTTMAEGDLAQVRRLFAHDFVQVDDHIRALDSLLVELKRCRLTAYDLRDLQVRILSPDSALTAYHVVNTFECGTPERPVSQSFDNNSVTVWVRQPGTRQWLVETHTETPAKP